jgi:hypothetical protein
VDSFTYQGTTTNITNTDLKFRNFSINYE